MAVFSYTTLFVIRSITLKLPVPPSTHTFAFNAVKGVANAFENTKRPASIYEAVESENGIPPNVCDRAIKPGAPVSPVAPTGSPNSESHSLQLEDVLFDIC